MPTVSAPYAVGSTVFPSISSPYSASGGRSNDRNEVAGLTHIGTDPLHLSHGYPRQHHYRPNYNHYRPGHYYHGYRPLCYPRSYYPSYGFGYYPWYGLGYAYSTVYLTEPYVGQTYVSPEYVEPAYSTSEDAATDQYTAGPTQTVPPQIAPSQPLPESAENYPSFEPAEQRRTIVSNANNAFAAGRYEEAKGLYVRAVMTDERDGYAKTLYAWANFAIGDYEVAAAALRRALLTTPDLVDYPLDLRTLYPDRAVLDRHADALMRFIADHPQHREAQLLWGYLLYSIGQAEPAASVFTSLAVADQNDSLLSLLRDAAVRNARGSSPAPTAP